MDGERAILEAAHPEHGPWEPSASDLPRGGPERLWRGRAGAIGWVAPSARIARERAGHALLGDHPAQPIVLAASERALVLAPFGAPVADPAAVVRSWPSHPARVEGTRRALLRSLSTELDLPRALAAHAPVRRRHVDRWLDATVSLTVDRGVSSGGVPGGWLRTQGDRVVCLRCDRVRADGWKQIDLAAVGDATIDPAMELARVAVWTRELAIADDAELSARLAELLAPETPARVRVWIDGPAFVDPAIWCAPGALVPAARARFLLAHLDGLSVGGSRLRVRTDPPIRPGRRAALREDRASRRRRTFARWDVGIVADEEGLVGATPEAIASRIAAGAHGVVIDATCGIGSLAIAFARQPAVTRVVAIDRSADRLRMARHNARVYGVEDRIELVRGDFEQHLDLEGDLWVIDPPWGGRSYDRGRVTLAELGIGRAIARIRSALVLKLPRSFDVATLPGGFSIEPMVDERGILKMLVARRDALS